MSTHINHIYSKGDNMKLFENEMKVILILIAFLLIWNLGQTITFTYRIKNLELKTSIYKEILNAHQKIFQFLLKKQGFNIDNTTTQIDTLEISI
jgi:hypothetical protein